MITIRREKPEDIAQVRRINELAFEQTTEADLVDKLRQACAESISLVAEDDFVVGHILFSPVVIDAGASQLVGMALGPMAVLPERQRQGIGTRLVEHGLEIIRDRYCPFVVVVGHPEYYPRFGFERSSKYGLASEWENMPDEAFMIAVLDREAMQGVSGIVKYRQEFSEFA